MIELVKLLWSIVPFVREMIWPGKTNKEILLANKFATAVTIVCILSLGLNYFLMSRIWEIAVERKNEHHVAVTAVAASAAASAASGPTAATIVVPLPPGQIASGVDPDQKAKDALRDRLKAIFGNGP